MREEGGAGSANIPQSPQIYSAHRVAHRVWLGEGGERREGATEGEGVRREVKGERGEEGGGTREP